VPEVIDVVLFPKGKVIPPGDMIITGPIDVSGAQHLTVNVVLGDPLTNVVCDIRFGRANEIFPGRAVGPTGGGSVTAGVGDGRPGGSKG
jgi:hypothetical protein